MNLSVHATYHIGLNSADPNVTPALITPARITAVWPKIQLFSTTPALI